MVGHKILRRYIKNITGVPETGRQVAFEFCNFFYFQNAVNKTDSEELC